MCTAKAAYDAFAYSCNKIGRGGVFAFSLKTARFRFLCSCRERTRVRSQNATRGKLAPLCRLSVRLARCGGFVDSAVKIIALLRYPMTFLFVAGIVYRLRGCSEKLLHSSVCFAAICVLFGLISFPILIHSLWRRVSALRLICISALGKRIRQKRRNVGGCIHGIDGDTLAFAFPIYFFLFCCNIVLLCLVLIGNFYAIPMATLHYSSSLTRK